MGDGTLVFRTIPVQLPGVWTSLAPGGFFTVCGIRTDSTGWCWGHNAKGGVGDGRTTDRTTRYQLQGRWSTFPAPGTVGDAAAGLRLHDVRHAP
ncbi:MAG: hypothetical protein ABI083_20195 [Lapillicoccus sp.]